MVRTVVREYSGGLWLIQCQEEERALFVRCGHYPCARLAQFDVSMVSGQRIVRYSEVLPVIASYNTTQTSEQTLHGSPRPSWHTYVRTSPGLSPNRYSSPS